MNLQAEVFLLAPSNNPHPPKTKIEIEKVKFAQEVLQSTLMKDWPNLKATPKVISPDEAEYLDKDLACLKDSNCFSKDVNFTAELLQIQKLYGKVLEVKHAHVVPVAPKSSPGPSVSYPPELQGTAPLKPGEFTVHLYIKMKKEKEAWFNLDLIMTQKDSGELFLRQFFIVAIQERPPC